MNSQVFDALSALKVVTSPDLDLRQLLGLQTGGDGDLNTQDFACIACSWLSLVQ